MITESKVSVDFLIKRAKEIQVVIDSNADCRYLVIPRRPDGTDGLSEEALARLVTRDSMIGVADALTPEEYEKVAFD